MYWQYIKRNTLLVLSKKLKKRFKSQNWNLILNGIIYFDDINYCMVKYFVKNQKVFLNNKLIFNISIEEKRTLASFRL